MQKDEMQKVSIHSIAAGKKVVLIGVPGAFTPTCSMQHVPGFIASSNELKSKGVDEILLISGSGDLGDSSGVIHNKIDRQKSYQLVLSLRELLHRVVVMDVLGYRCFSVTERARKIIQATVPYYLIREGALINDNAWYQLFEGREVSANCIDPSIISSILSDIQRAMADELESEIFQRQQQSALSLFLQQQQQAPSPFGIQLNSFPFSNAQIHRKESISLNHLSVAEKCVTISSSLENNSAIICEQAAVCTSKQEAFKNGMDVTVDFVREADIAQMQSASEGTKQHLESDDSVSGSHGTFHSSQVSSEYKVEGIRGLKPDDNPDEKDFKDACNSIEVPVNCVSDLVQNEHSIHEEDFQEDKSPLHLVGDKRRPETQSNPQLQVVQTQSNFLDKLSTSNNTVNEDHNIVNIATDADSKEDALVIFETLEGLKCEIGNFRADMRLMPAFQIVYLSFIPLPGDNQTDSLLATEHWHSERTIGRINFSIVFLFAGLHVESSTGMEAAKEWRAHYSQQSLEWHLQRGVGVRIFNIPAPCGQGASIRGWYCYEYIPTTAPTTVTTI